MKTNTNIRKVQRWLERACIALAVIVVAVSVYLFVHWWSGWWSAALAICAFLAFAACATLPVFALTFLLAGSHLWDDDGAYEAFLVALSEIAIAAFLALPLWCYHERTGGETPFWSWIMLSVSIGVPLVIFVIACICSVKANKKDRQIDADLKAKWQPFALGDAEASFKESVEDFRRALNLHFANKCCMKMIAASDIQWHIVDTYLKEEKIAVLANDPTSSFAMLRTVFVVRGEKINVWLKLFHGDSAYLGWNGVKKGEKSPSWQELITAIEKKIEAK